MAGFKITYILLFLVSISNSFSQLQIHPLLGVSYNGNQIIQGKNQYINARKVQRSDLDEGFLVTQSIGDRYKLNYGYIIGTLGHGWELSYTQNTPYKSYYGSFPNRDLHIFSFNVGRETKTFQFFKQKIVGSPFKEEGYIKIQPKYYLRFSLIPFLGFSYNLVNTKTKSNIDENGYSVKGSLLDDYEVKTYVGKNNAFILKSSGASLQSGTRIQFKRNNKDKFCIHLLLNISFQKYYETNVSYKLKENPNWFSAKFITRGHFFAISLSYPITILNKKGERYRDRHPKK